MMAKERLIHLGILCRALYTSVAFQSDRGADSDGGTHRHRHVQSLVASQNLAALVPS